MVMPSQTVHPSVGRNCFIPFMGSQGFLLGPVPAVSGREQGTPWTSHQLITGPFTDGRGEGPELSPELGFEPTSFQSLANLLYLLSYSCQAKPSVQTALNECEYLASGTEIMSWLSVSGKKINDAPGFTSETRGIQLLPADLAWYSRIRWTWGIKKKIYISAMCHCSGSGAKICDRLISNHVNNCKEWLLDLIVIFVKAL